VGQWDEGGRAVSRVMHPSLPRPLPPPQNFLYWYSNHHERQPKGVLFLEGSYVTPLSEAAHTAKGYWGFCIQTSSEHGERSRALYARSEAERNEWMSALRRACRSVPFAEEYELGEWGAGATRSRPAGGGGGGGGGGPPPPAAGGGGGGGPPTACAATTLLHHPRLPRRSAGHEVGVGRFSRVFLATRRSTGEVFAVKLITKASLTEAERELLRTEIAILRLVQHPHIVRLETVFESGTQIFIVMEYLQGGELFNNIVGRSRFSEAEARELMKPLVESLAYLHSLGICHR
jgi:hypothetical protein